MENKAISKSAFLFLPPVQADYPLLSHEEETIARKASVARGWMVTFGGRL